MRPAALDLHDSLFMVIEASCLLVYFLLVAGRLVIHYGHVGVEAGDAFAKLIERLGNLVEKPNQKTASAAD